jgi:hypothetical protein
MTLKALAEPSARLVRPGQRVFTILGWTPGLRRLMGGHVMTCGCLVGSYETCQGDFIEIVDVPSRTCGHKEHTEHFVVSRSEHPQRVFFPWRTDLSDR